MADLRKIQLINLPALVSAKSKQRSCRLPTEFPAAHRNCNHPPSPRPIPPVVQTLDSGRFLPQSDVGKLHFANEEDRYRRMRRANKHNCTGLDKDDLGRIDGVLVNRLPVRLAGACC